ncbi:Tetratricopeptide repeat protein [Planctomycetes bacterium Poly30]|uniref:Tetratricopeptide repeat protein n=1 Tax=Saltatorellus ferox TaxID=2528018 RepID=A0A518EVW4_9BACT|nr:Tetratricopeptide repeat protein [Planctomycetes bacterium Poly30]
MQKTSNRSVKLSAPWPLWALVCLGAFLPACGGDSEGGAGSSSGSAIASSAKRRLMDPKVVNVRELIDKGRPDLARTVLASFGPQLVADLGVEEPLLRARISFLEGREAEWLALVEEARAIDPKDPRPYATSVEIYAAMGRLEAARAELERGATAVGSVVTPELQRARGIVAIVTPGGAKVGLGFLESAYRADEGLPFIARPLGQAYYLMAQAAFAEDQADLAMERMETSLRFDPEDMDARQFYGKLLIAVRQDFVAGLDVLEQLHREGQAIGVELARHHWQAGLIAQVQGESEIARKHYLRAKELGSREVETGTARTFMREQSSHALDKAVAAARVGDEDGVRSAIAEFAALRTDPQDIAQREIALTMIGEADRALTQGDTEAATGLIAAALLADRGATGIAEVQCALFQSKAIDALQAGETDQALRYAVEATQVRPDSIDSWRMLGELQYALGDYAGAAASLLKATAYARATDEPLGIEVSQMLAESQHLSQNSIGAVATLEQALREARPEDAEIRDEIERYLRVLKD